MTRLRDIETSLRLLDPADRDIDAGSGRALADLQHILATEHGGDLQPPPSAPGARHARNAPSNLRRVAVAAGLLAALTVGMVVVPSVTGGDEAFASWTSNGEGLDAPNTAAAANSCRSSQAEAVRGEAADNLAKTTPVLAERRGVWTTVVLGGADGFTAMCITDESSGLFTRDMIGSVGTATGDVEPDRREVIATSLGSGTMKAGDLSLVAGTAGAEVIEIVYRSDSHGDITATISRGHFAFWWPGDELLDVGSKGIQVEVTYRDGSTRAARLHL